MSETQELVQIGQQNQEVAAYSADHESGLDSIRLKPTELKLCQNTTQNDGAVPGQFFDVAFGESYKEVTVVPLKFWRPKTLFPPGNFQAGVKPLCKSDDGEVPSPYVETPQSSSCKTCPKNVWKKGPGGKAIRPECSDKIRFLLFIQETGLPKLMTLTGKSITVANAMLQAVAQFRKMTKAKEGWEPALHDFYFTLKADRVTGPNGVGYVARFDNIKRVNADDRNKFGPIFEEYVINYKRGAGYDEEGGEVVDSAAQSDGVVHEAEIVNEV